MSYYNYKKKLYEIYTTNEESFSVGYIIYENETETLFKVFDELGREYALYLIKKSMITSLVSDTVYLKKLKIYIDYWREVKPIPTSHEDELNIHKEFMFNQVLEHVALNNSIVTIRRLNSDDVETGFISKSGGEEILLRCISLEDAAIYDEISLSSDDIWFIEFNSLENDVLLYAYRNFDK